MLFDTEQEKDNIVNFMYSEDGFRFMSKIFKALNVDAFINPKKFMPKVDWKRPWTPEQVLREYGYTQSEIDDIIDDLKNYRYMDEAK